MATPLPGSEPANSGPPDRRAALVLAGLLIAAGVLIGLSPVIRVATSVDGSPTTPSVIAAFVAVLPGLLAMALALRAPSLGLAATAGAGALGVVRIFADLAVITETDAVTRPELFVETTDRARPFAVGAGAWVLLVADLMMLGAGVLAATRLGRSLLSSADLAPEAFFGSSATAESVAEQMEIAVDGPDAPQDPVSVVALSRPPPGRLGMNLPMVSVGFLGAVLLMVGALEIPYTGGYLALRVLPLGSSLSGVLAAALLGLVTAVVVLVAASLPRRIAQALLAGTALAAAVPSLTAVIAVLTGAPTGLSAAVWWGLAGAVILGVAGLLARGGAARVGDADSSGEPPQHWLTVGTGVLALLAAAGLAAASQTALLNIDGAAPDGGSGAVLEPAGPPLLIAAVPLAVAGILALVRPTASYGRAGVAVLWAGAVYAMGQALWVRSLVLDSVNNPLIAEVAAEFPHSWTSGPGLWLGALGTLLAGAAAVAAIITARRADQASLEVVEDGSLADSRAARRWLAVGLTVLTVLALALPVYSYLARGASATLILGYELDTWGVWAVAISAVAAIWAAALTRRPGVAAAYLISAAAVVVQPLVVPGAVRAQPGFALGAGFWAGIVTVIALLSGAAVFAVMARRVRLIDQSALAAMLSDSETDRTGVESKGG